MAEGAIQSFREGQAVAYNQGRRMIPFIEAALDAKATGVHKSPDGIVRHATIEIADASGALTTQNTLISGNIQHRALVSTAEVRELCIQPGGAYPSPRQSQTPAGVLLRRCR
jgi:hypothetical protein